MARTAAATLELAHLRASQINGCSSCVNSGSQAAKKAGETGERLFTVAARREAPYVTDAERAAPALTEAVTPEWLAVARLTAYAPDLNAVEAPGRT